MNKVHGNIPVAAGRGRGKLLLSADGLREMIRKRRRLANSKGAKRGLQDPAT